MTERLYYTDSHTLAFNARVAARVEHNGHPAVILDRTYFYPEGGGQPCDTGTIGGVAVVDVQTQPETLEVIHVLAESLTAEVVACEVDRVRRLDHMQHHTGQHILTQAFVSVADAHTVSFHLSPDSVTIDLDKANLSPEVLNAAEDLANQVVLEDRPVTVRLINPDDTEGVRMRKMPDYLATDGLRVVEVQDFDSTACGGTHVARTGEIGQIKITRTEKYKGGTRVEFRCGGRALTDYRARQAVTAALAADFSAAFSEVPQLVGKLRGDLRDTQKALKEVQTALAAYEAADLIQHAETRGSARLIRRVLEGRDPASVRALASKAVETPGLVVLLGVPGAPAHVFTARSGDLTTDMPAALRVALAALGSEKGGGRPDFAQGTAPQATVEALEAALLAVESVVFQA